ncbi:hypothetical protein TOPH_08973 [Tolypocladium ophioglossoides CBS 100239]|uniref:Uncharacterized protein n=1 Tax=Tolypocladium ophioglossoides (strain CBS 100239) TaxID=1163406 RepID=A0A0L0MY44_TOLOC|nr:hypothetical protein TOPH_08973 [Tolypocladium ophioglossoides CBS 100239]
MWARIHLIPLLQAEEDRDQVRRYWADQKREKELLGDNTKVYNNDRYCTLALPCPCTGRLRVRVPFLTLCCRFVRPTFAVAPSPTK